MVKRASEKSESQNPECVTLKRYHSNGEVCVVEHTYVETTLAIGNMELGVTTKLCTNVGVVEYIAVTIGTP